MSNRDVKKTDYRLTIYLGKELYTNLKDTADALDVSIRTLAKLALEMGFNVATAMEESQSKIERSLKNGFTKKQRLLYND